MTTSDCIDCYAVPGHHTIVDLVHPLTGLTLYGGETGEQLRARYPDAVLMPYKAWATTRGDQQHAPITWHPTTQERYDYMLNVLPPAFWRGGLVLVGEPTDHSVRNGAPLFDAVRRTGLSEDTVRYTASSRPITIAEARAILAGVSAYEATS